MVLFAISYYVTAKLTKKFTLAKLSMYLFREIELMASQIMMIPNKSVFLGDYLVFLGDLLVFLGRFAFIIWDISLGSYFSEMELAASRFFWFTTSA